MAQHDYVISNGTGAAVRSDLNNALLAIVSQNSGATEPTTTYAYQWWADTTTGLLKIRNSANNAWITLRELDGTLTVEDGTVSAPGLAFRDDLNTGIWRPGTDQFAISTNGVERVEWGTSEVVFNDGGTNYDFRVEGDNNANLLFVDASADAVGIGTSSVNGLLHIGIADSRAILLNNSSIGTAAGDGTYISNKTDGTFAIINQENASFTLGTNNTDRITITGGGLVGIGSTTLIERLHVNGGVRLDVNDQGLYFNSSTTAITGNGTSSYIAFNTSNAEKARLDSSGRWLLGTSSGLNDARLQVVGNTGGDPGRIDIRRNADNPTTNTEIGTIRFSDLNGASGQYATIQCFADAASTSSGDLPGRLVFSTTDDGASSPTEAMRITRSQQVLIGNTSPNEACRLFSQSNTDTAGPQIVLHNSKTGTASSNSVVFYRNSTGVGTIATTNTATAYNTSSDYRLKENVVAVSDGIIRLQQLKPSRFNFIADPDKTVDGFIAHEVQAVVPEAITGEKDAEDADGKPIYQGIDQSKLVPLLTAALQEAVAKIESLEARLTAAGI